jgi:hypothetical protein
MDGRSHQGDADHLARRNQAAESWRIEINEARPERNVWVLRGLSLESDQPFDKA